MQGKTMNGFEESDPRMAPGEVGVDVPITPQEKFVNQVYSSLDGAITRELARLRSDDGIVPTCASGCPYCCRDNIVTSVAEAHALAQYVKREFSSDRIDSLRIRTKKWHEWSDYRLGRHASTGVQEQTYFSDYEPYCPILVDGACSAYPVRPVVCRTHYIRSDAGLCREANTQGATSHHPVLITSILEETKQFSVTIRDYIESTIGDFSRSRMLLPHWLAIQMGWDFAIAP